MTERITESRSEQPEDPSAAPGGLSAPDDTSAGGDGAAVAAPAGSGGSRSGERIFRALTSGSGLVVVAAIILIGLFLLIQAVPSIVADQDNVLTSPTFDAQNLRFGIRDLLVVTVLSSLVALVIAMPLALGIALFLTQYAPASLARPFNYVVGLLAAVPSIVFGLWGVKVFGPTIAPVAAWLQDHLGWFPLFAPGNIGGALGGSIFTAGIVLAVMILPIITAVAREVFSQTPAIHREAAQALGATRWEVIRMAVLPYGRSGYIAGSMLGLGRALGETVAVLFILRTASTPSHVSLFDGGYTFASKIASGSSEFTQPLPTGAYITAGLVLFVLTFVVNAIARVIAGGKVNG